ncbi:hypothetical protein H8D36_06780 [archaeon]|nr:hypothetical protein [archaeon]MBL7057476.1 hypothetical protein [Candidatus Woesearchaeota archaeon]
MNREDKDLISDLTNEEFIRYMKDSNINIRALCSDHDYDHDKNLFLLRTNNAAEQKAKFSAIHELSIQVIFAMKDYMVKPSTLTRPGALTRQELGINLAILFNEQLNAEVYFWKDTNGRLLQPKTFSDEHIVGQALKKSRVKHRTIGELVNTSKYVPIDKQIREGATVFYRRVKDASKHAMRFVKEREKNYCHQRTRREIYQELGRAIIIPDSSYETPLVDLIKTGIKQLANRRINAVCSETEAKNRMYFDGEVPFEISSMVLQTNVLRGLLGKNGTLHLSKVRAFADLYNISQHLRTRLKTISKHYIAK